MIAMFSDGTVFLVILAITVVEGVALAVWRGRTGLAPLAVLFHLGAGGFILLAAFLAVTGAWWGWTGACLALSGLSHVIDLRRRIST